MASAGLLIGVEHQVDADCVSQAATRRAAQVAVLQPCDGRWHACLLRLHAHEQVDLVGIGDGHYDLSAFEAGFCQHAGVGAAPVHGEQVDLGGQRVETPRVLVDDDDVVALTAEASGDVASDLAGPHHENPHNGRPYFGPLESEVIMTREAPWRW